jgi:hypothetical protein
MTPEGEVQKAILDYLSVRGIFHWRVNTGAMRRNGRLVRFGTAGVSDIIGVLPGGRILAIEVKAPKKYPTEAQKDFLAQVKAAGGVGFVAYGVEDVAEHLRIARETQA